MSNPISPDMVRHLKLVGEPSLSPDGSALAYALAWVDEESMESRSRVMMMNFTTESSPNKSGQGPVEFTQGDKDRAPKFSPSGDTLAFLRSSAEVPGQGDAKRQIWLMSAGGGEARQLTHESGGVTELAWSPDSRQIAFCADVEPAPSVQANSMPQVKEVTRLRYRYDTLGWRGDAHFHIFVSEVSSGATIQLTDGDWDDFSPVWSPDGTNVAFISGRGADRDKYALTEAYVVPAAGGEPLMWSEGLSSAGAVAWSPDSSSLLVIGSDVPGYLGLWQSWLYVLQEGKPPRQLTDDLYRPYLGFPGITPPPELRWQTNNRILYLGERRGESFLLELPVEGGNPQSIISGGLISGFCLDYVGETGVLLRSTAESPADLYRVELKSHTDIQLTSHNLEYLEGHPAARMEKFCIDREGTEIECRLFLPPGFDANRKYPLVLDIHGGPNGAFYDSFVAWQQVLATDGYLVLAVNPRGSSTYGNDFMMAVLGDWGGDDYLDLMAAVDAVSDRPYVDAGRIGIHGYSYGGYMTSWAIGHTDRFKAAVIGAPCIDLHSMYGTSDIGISFGELQWECSVEEAQVHGVAGMENLSSKLLQRSPITYAHQVQSPVLLLHGEADARCPISQSEAYFTMLKRLNKEVEFVRFPDCSHLFPRLGHPKMREEYLARTLAWFQRYV